MVRDLLDAADDPGIGDRLKNFAADENKMSLGIEYIANRIRVCPEFSKSIL